MPPTAVKLAQATEQQPGLAPAGAVLLTPQQLAERLAVPTTWIREKCRHRALVRDRDPLPYIKLGKYIRFRWADVEVWLNRQATHDHGAGSRLADRR